MARWLMLLGSQMWQRTRPRSRPRTRKNQRLLVYGNGYRYAKNVYDFIWQDDFEAIMGGPTSHKAT